MIHWHRAADVLQVADLLLEQGIAPAQLLRRVGVSPSILLDPEGWIQRRLVMRLVNQLVHWLGDDFAGVHVVERIQLEQLGAWGRGVMSSRTLGEALEAATRKIGHLHSGTQIWVDCEGDTAVLRFRYLDELGENPRQHLEADLAMLRRIIGMASEPVPVEARLASERPGGVDELERVFGPRLAFQVPVSELRFPREALNLPLRHPPARPLPWTTLGTPSSPRESARAVVLYLREHLQYERPTLPAVAAGLEMNLRMLQRHLAAWGLTFEEILDQYRHRYANEYLRNGGRSITDIAFLLGYSDSAHFSRAFRRWTGESPKSHIAALRTAPSSQPQLAL